MRYVLSSTLILLSVATYPIFLRVSSELGFLWGRVEWDIFHWNRMLIVALVGIPALALIRKKDYALISYVSLAVLSTLLSRFPETSLFGYPSYHEGLLALLGYVGIYLIGRKVGGDKLIEKAFLISIYAVFAISIIGLIYGNFLEFPPFKMLMPDVSFGFLSWPLYSTMGSPNHLGLFCALFFPYAVLKKRWVTVACLLFMLIGSQTRGALLSVGITTLIISRRYLFYIVMASIILSIPIQGKVIERIKRTANEIHWPIKDTDLSGRAYMWTNTLPIVKNTMLIGNGPGTFPIYFPQYTNRAKEIWPEMAIVDRPHNMYLSAWHNTGFISLIILLTAIIIRIRNATDPALKWGVIGFLIAGLFTDSVLCVTPYFVTMLGMMRDHEHT